MERQFRCPSIGQHPVLVEPPKPKPPEPPKLAEVKLPDVVQRDKPLPKATAQIAQPDIAEPKLEVRTNVFSTGSSAKPTTNLPASQVQTGGFGDPNGIRGEGKPGKPGNIASLGSFDLPVGPGAGNGTGGVHGVKGVVASPGFGWPEEIMVTKPVLEELQVTVLVRFRVLPSL